MTSTPPHELPQGLQVLERGWLSANNIVLTGRDGTALIDSGYGHHADQTLALVASALGGRPLDRLLNTHLHSDHCGGNAALQQRYPALHTAIPPGHADAVTRWDEEVLTYAPTGQFCPRFRHDSTLRPGGIERLGDLDWEVHAAPGHDPHSVLFFEPASRTLISADALWENGFGVVFPELEGERAFDEVATTLDLIAALNPKTVIPGHGRVFTDAPSALATARRRLEGFIQDPVRHALYAAKVLVKFKLLEWQRIELTALSTWVHSTRYFQQIASTHFADHPLEVWVHRWVDDLERSGAARREGPWVLNL